MVLQLPEELLQHIFSFLTLPRTSDLVEAIHKPRRPTNTTDLSRADIRLSQNTLFSICLASSSFYRLAWPALYSAYSDYRIGNHAAYSADFLRTLCLKPEHGNALRSLAIRSRRSTEFFRTAEPYAYYENLNRNPMTMALFQWRARNFWFAGHEGGAEFQDLLIGSLLEGSDDAIMIMILLLCPNIAELHLAIPEDFHEGYLLGDMLETTAKPQTVPVPDNQASHESPSSRLIANQMFGASWPQTQLRQPKFLQNLVTLTLRKRDGMLVEMSMLPKLMSLPKLRTLTMSGLVDESALDGGEGNIQADCGWLPFPQIRHLRLPDCILMNREMLRLIPCFSSLRTLDVAWNESILNYTPISFKQVGSAIARHMPQLASLTLDASNCWNDWRDGEDNGEHLAESLRPMSSLTSLKVSEQAIWNPEYMPVDTHNHGSNFGLQSSLPASTKSLEIVSPSSGQPDLGWDELEGQEYEAWQERDLRNLLLNDHYPNLERVVTSNRADFTQDLDEDEWRAWSATIHRRGWNLTIREARTGVGVECEVLRTMPEAAGATAVGSL